MTLSYAEERRCYSEARRYHACWLRFGPSKFTYREIGECLGLVGSERARQLVWSGIKRKIWLLEPGQVGNDKIGNCDWLLQSNGLSKAADGTWSRVEQDTPGDYASMARALVATLDAFLLPPVIVPGGTHDCPALSPVPPRPRRQDVNQRVHDLIREIHSMGPAPYRILLRRDAHSL